MPPSYLVISPVKDEQRNIEVTIGSMLAQTVKPLRWIIVDDASTDGTPSIVAKYADENDWISVIRLSERHGRLLGSAEVVAFNAGYETVRDTSAELIVKLDGDIRLPPRYFEELLNRFEQRPRLGIASGSYVEHRNGTLDVVPMPEYHAAGACKVIRRRCFEDIGGFVAARGWDTVDEIRAQTLGWDSCHFSDLIFEHLRAEGSADGSLRTNLLHGEAYYATGGSLLFLVVKVLHRMIQGRPPVIAGLTLLAGFLKPALLRHQRLVSKAEAGWYRRTLNQRIWQKVLAFSR